MVSTPTEELIRSYLEKDRNIKEKSPEEQKRVLQTYIQKVITHNGMNPNDKSLEIHAIVDANGGDEGSRTPVQKPFEATFSERSH